MDIDIALFRQGQASNHSNGLFNEDIAEAAALNPEGTLLFATENDGSYFNWVRVAGSEKFQKACIKCGGDGQHWAQHVADGECFRCWGSGFEPRTNSYTKDDLVKRAAAIKRAYDRKEAKRLAECAVRDVRVEAFAAAEPVLAALLAATREQISEVYNGTADKMPAGFLVSMSDRLYNVIGGGDLTENMIAALRKFAEPKVVEEGTEVVEGRIVITGEIISIKEVEGDFGTVTKIVVKDDRGFRVYGSLQRDIADADKGARISFTATVEASSDDKSFGFFKRPIKGVAL